MFSRVFKKKKANTTNLCTQNESHRALLFLCFGNQTTVAHFMWKHHLSQTSVNLPFVKSKLKFSNRKSMHSLIVCKVKTQSAAFTLCLHTITLQYITLTSERALTGSWRHDVEPNCPPHRHADVLCSAWKSQIRLAAVTVDNRFLQFWYKHKPGAVQQNLKKEKEHDFG